MGRNHLQGLILFFPEKICVARFLRANRETDWFSTQFPEAFSGEKMKETNMEVAYSMDDHITDLLEIFKEDYGSLSIFQGGNYVPEEFDALLTTVEEIAKIIKEAKIKMMK